MKIIKSLIFSSLTISSIAENISDLKIHEVLNTYPGPAYQDLIINNEIVRKGTDMCENRYLLFREIFNLFNKPFSVLDIGAAQGYFSFRIAHDYPLSHCTLIGANSGYYGNHGDMLLDMCRANNYLNNITYLNKLINVQDLKYLNKNEHFDVILAFLVIHQIDESMVKRIAVIDELLKLGDNVIIEVSNDVAPELAHYCESLSKKIECIYLGEVRRHYNFESKALGKFFCFRKTIRRQ